MGDAGVHGPSVVTGIKHLLQRRVEHLRQALSAQRFGTGQGRPTAFDIGPIRVGKALRSGDPPLSQTATLAIANAVQRRQDATAETPGLLQHLHGQRQIQRLEY
ncbi:hypothetical protein D3C76_1082100 [compost metagenome]